MLSQGAIRAGKNISDRFRVALPNLTEENAMTLAQIIDSETKASAMIELLTIIVANAKMIPDPSMQGATDIYAVPLGDIEAAKFLLTKL